MDEIIALLTISGIVVIGLPWLVLHYITRWKTAPTLTSGDEALLDELYQLARRLEDRMDTVERLVAADDPDFQPARLARERDRDAEVESLDEIERLRTRRGRKAR